MKQPQRQCAACRVRRHKQDLIRIVRTQQGKTAVDLTQKADGRGVYLCPAAACVTRAYKHDLLSAHLKVPVSAGMYQELASLAARKSSGQVASALSMSVKAGKAVLGLGAVKDAAGRQKLQLVVYDPGASSASLEKLASVCKIHSIQMLPFTRAGELDAAVGKPNCRAAGIVDRGLAEMIIAAAEK